MIDRRYFGIGWLLAALFIGTGYAQGFSEADQEKALEQIGKLESDRFATRGAAMATLEQLPADAVPWLEDLLDLTGSKDIELRSRLKSILRTLKKREAELTLREGTRVKIELDAARPEEVLAALTMAAGASLSMPNQRDYWADGSKQKFVFEGSFWEAVDAMLEIFPTRSADREKLSDGGYRMGRWRATDFKAAAQTSVNNGILRVRHARMALEINGGKDYLVMTLVPSVEPGYQVDGLVLSVKALALEDGTLLEPQQKSIEWQARANSSQFSPAAAFTWIFPLEKGVKLSGVAGIEGAASIAVRRLIWSEIDLPEDLNTSAKMNGHVELQVLEREEGKLKIQFQGKGAVPASFEDYYARREAYQVLDKDGNRLDFSVNSTSTGGGGDGWRNAFGGTIVGEPAKVKAQLPSGIQSIDLKFDLFDLPMPGSSLVE